MVPYVGKAPPGRQAREMGSAREFCQGPFVDTFRTLCLAPLPIVSDILLEIDSFSLATASYES